MPLYNLYPQYKCLSIPVGFVDVENEQEKLICIENEHK